MRLSLPPIVTMIWAWQQRIPWPQLQGARQIECTINGLGEQAGNTALEEVVMALKVRGDIMPYFTEIDTTKLMNISRRVATVSAFCPIQQSNCGQKRLCS